MADITEVDYIWKNGEMVPWAEANTHILSHSLHYGSGVFEGIRCYQDPDSKKSYVFRLRDHMERLHRSCKIAQIDLPYSVDELMDATLEVIRANKLPPGTTPDGWKRWVSAARCLRRSRPLFPPTTTTATTARFWS